MDLALELSGASILIGHNESFNPCFNGSCSRIFFQPGRHTGQILVSILVLMDLALEYDDNVKPVCQITVSILVLMDLALECKSIHTENIEIA